MKTYRVLSIDVGIVNLAFCIVDFVEDDGSTTFDLIHVEKTRIGTMKDRLQKLMESVIDFFRESEVINDKPIDYIYVEQQLSRAIKNCMLAFVIMSYFYTDSRISMNNTKMNFLPPRKKFAAIRAAMGDCECLEGIDFDVYGSRDLKKLSVNLSRRIFEYFEVNRGLDALVKYKPKLDDVCDVFLQSFAIFLDQETLKKGGNPIRLFST